MSLVRITPPDRYYKMLINCRRLLQNHSGRGITLLHAVTSPDVFPPLQRLVSTGRVGWSRSSPFQSVDAVWRCLGYGDRQVYDVVPTCIPELGVASLGSSIPGAN